MQFECEISLDDYVAAQVLCSKTSAKGQFVKRALLWLLLGLFFILTAAFRWAPDWLSILQLLIGAWFIYGGIASLLPTRLYRRYYAKSDVAGKSYHAEVDENGFSVSGDACSWRVPWTEVRLKGEDKRVFMFKGKGTIFSFGKKYLTDQQQKEIRRFAEML
jgi:hypothetical protein